MKIVKSIDELFNALGIKKGDKIEIITPQFERDYKLEIDFIPQDKNELTALIESAPKEILQKMGVGVWCSYKTDKEAVEKTYLKPDEIHYLFPHEWFNFIPQGFECVSISGNKFKFDKKTADDDMRFGCLSFGFIRKF